MCHGDYLRVADDVEAQDRVALQIPQVGWARRYDHVTVKRTDAVVAELLAKIT